MSSVEKELDVVEAEIFECLPLCAIQELEGLFEVIGKVLPETAKGKKNQLLKLLYKHLTVLEESEDNGFATLQLLHKKLTEKANEDDKVEGKVVTEEMVDTKAKVGTDDKVTQEDTLKKLGELLMSSLSSGASPIFNEPKPVGKREKERVTEYVHRYQTLKLNGKIAADKGNMTFTDLKFQVQNATKQGYPDESIRSAIITAVEDEDLKLYLERKTEIPIDDIIDFLRPHFIQKDSSVYFNELSNAMQKPGQTSLKFAQSLLSLKELIVELSKEEGEPLDESRLSKQVMKTLYSGIKNTNIRTEIRESCRGLNNITDFELMKIVTAASMSEEERENKFGQGKNVSQVSADTPDSVCESKSVNNKKKENLLPAQVQELKVSHQKEISALKNQFEQAQVQNKANFDELKSLLTASCNLIAGQNNNQSSMCSVPNLPAPNFSALQTLFPSIPQVTGTNRRSSSTRYKCQVCIANNAFRCFHCLCCGSGDHRMVNCPNNQNASAAASAAQNGAPPNM